MVSLDRVQSCPFGAGGRMEFVLPVLMLVLASWACKPDSGSFVKLDPGWENDPSHAQGVLAYDPDHVRAWGLVGQAARTFHQPLDRASRQLRLTGCIWKGRTMSMNTRQVPTLDVASLTSLIFLIIYFLIFYWFYSILTRMEKLLKEIKETLQSRTPAAQAPSS